MEKVTSIAQLQAKLDEAKRKQQISDNEFRSSLSSWYLSHHVFDTAPKDPYSSEFKDFQLSVYEQLTQNRYHVTNEETHFDFEHEFKWPYPYGTQSAYTVGAHLIGYGWLIQKMNLPPESRILEIGSGYGSLTVHLASMGYQVTCLDINPSFLEFIRKRTANFPQPVHTICGDMATVEIEDTFDAIIFNASFHHSLEHRDVLKRLSASLTPNGLIVFASEPVFPRYVQHIMPYPWGIRLDGISIWSICQWGWLELGFQKSYFKQIMREEGYQLTHYSALVSDHADIWIATRGIPLQTRREQYSTLLKIVVKYLLK